MLLLAILQGILTASPIPSRDGTIMELDSIPLADLRPGQSGVVDEVSDHDPDLTYDMLAKWVYIPKTKFKVISIEPFNGPIKIKVDEF